MKTKPPKRLLEKPGVRARFLRRTNAWRVWWEPSAAQRRAGMEPVDLDPERPTWSAAQADRLNAEAGKRIGRTPDAKARRAAAGPGRFSIDAVIAEYLVSPRFSRLAAKTQANYRADHARILERWSGQHVRKLTRGVIYTWYETLHRNHGAHMASRLVRALSVVLSYAADKEYIDANPIYRLRLETPAGRARRVSWAEIDALIEQCRIETAFADRAPSRATAEAVRRAILLSFWFGQRQTDVLAARAGDFVMHALTGPDGVKLTPRRCWRIRRSKDVKLRRLNHLVANAEIAAEIEQWIDGAPEDAPVVSLGGRRIKEDWFRHRFAAIRDAAAKRLDAPELGDVQFRDLRRSFSSIAREITGNDRDAADVLGNLAATDPGLSQTYMPATDFAAARAIDAVSRPSRARSDGAA